MNTEKAIYLARKAGMLAEVTGCTVDEAIRYLAANESLQTANVWRRSELSGLSPSLIERLDGASTYYVML